MSAQFTTQRRVEFSDTDMAGIAHFTSYFRWMESVEHELLRRLGMSIAGRDGISWPRVSTTCNFRKPARFDEVLDVAAGIERIGEKSVTYSFVFSRAGETLAEGQMTSVCCLVEPGVSPEPIVIPPELRERLEQAMAER